MNKERVIYKVFPEHRVVVAEIHGCKHDARDVVDGIMDNVTSSFYVCLRRSDERFLMDNTFKTTAHCHPDDIFDEEIGKKIALKKLTEAYHRSLNKHVANYMKYFAAAADKMKEHLDKKHYMEGI